MSFKTWLLMLFVSAAAGMCCSCSGGSYLSEKQLESEQKEVVQYYTNRSDGMRFRSRFYDIRDSIRTSVSGGDIRTIELIYSRIAKKRALDSLDYISGAYFKILAGEFETDFDIAKGGRN